MAYRPEEIACTHKDGGKRVLLLSGGAVSRGHQASQATAVARRGETGYFPCCSVATHVAVPALFNLGEHSERKAIGMTIWRRRGPWALRSYAAAWYASFYDNLPTHWDWAARNLGMGGPMVPRQATRSSKHFLPGLIERALQ